MPYTGQALVAHSAKIQVRLATCWPQKLQPAPKSMADLAKRVRLMMSPISTFRAHEVPASQSISSFFDCFEYLVREKRNGVINICRVTRSYSNLFNLV